MVTYPTMVVMFSIIGISIYLGVKESVPYWAMAVGIGFGFISSWLCWSITITKWRVWAFQHVRNVHELKKMAIQEKLIWPDGSMFGKTEIWNAADKKKWLALQSKLQQADVFLDDATVGEETIVYYSKAKNIIQMVSMLLLLGAGIYLFFALDNFIWGAIGALIGAFFSIKEFSKATNKEPQIIINNRGLQTISTGFYRWSTIENIQITIEGSSNNLTCHLRYNHPDGTEELEIQDYDIEPKELENLIRVYKVRNSKGRLFR